MESGEWRVGRCSRTAPGEHDGRQQEMGSGVARLGTFERAGVLGWIKAGAARRRAVFR